MDEYIMPPACTKVNADALAKEGVQHKSIENFRWILDAPRYDLQTCKEKDEEPRAAGLKFITNISQVSMNYPEWLEED
ncbi:hypothetical protein Holit_02446 [Hollandina sp. SP2]